MNSRALTSEPKLLINDYGGYAFIRQLSGELAKRGYRVTYSFCASHTSTPRGYSDESLVDSSLQYWPIELKQPVNKYSLFARRRQEIEYGDEVASRLKQEGFDCVLSANMPLDAQRLLWKAACKIGARRVFWLQDFLGIATHRILSKRSKILGAMIGNYYRALERRLLLASEGIIAISAEFTRVLKSHYGIDSSRSVVIPNWAPLAEIALAAESLGQRTDNRYRFLYSGTLSLKHNPELLLRLAKAVRPHQGLVTVRSCGSGADWLKQQKALADQPNLVIADYAPYSELSKSLAEADALVAILEPHAAEYSVPSKVLTYMSAGKPLLLAVPSTNPAASVVAQHFAGLVSEPGDVDCFVNHAVKLISDHKLSQELGRNARKYAESHFEIGAIADRFVQAINCID